MRRLCFLSFLVGAASLHDPEATDDDQDLMRNNGLNEVEEWCQDAQRKVQSRRKGVEQLLEQVNPEANMEPQLKQISTRISMVIASLAQQRSLVEMKNRAQQNNITNAKLALAAGAQDVQALEAAASNLGTTDARALATIQGLLLQTNEAQQHYKEALDLAQEQQGDAQSDAIAQLQGQLESTEQVRDRALFRNVVAKAKSDMLSSALSGMDTYLTNIEQLCSREQKSREKVESDVSPCFNEVLSKVPGLKREIPQENKVVANVSNSTPQSSLAVERLQAAFDGSAPPMDSSSTSDASLVDTPSTPSQPAEKAVNATEDNSTWSNTFRGMLATMKHEHSTQQTTLNSTATEAMLDAVGSKPWNFSAPSQAPQSSNVSGEAANLEAAAAPAGTVSDATENEVAQDFDMDDAFMQFAFRGAKGKHGTFQLLSASSSSQTTSVVLSAYAKALQSRAFGKLAAAQPDKARLSGLLRVMQKEDSAGGSSTKQAQAEQWCASPQFAGNVVQLIQQGVERLDVARSALAEAAAKQKISAEQDKTRSLLQDFQKQDLKELSELLTAVQQDYASSKSELRVWQKKVNEKMSDLGSEGSQMSDDLDRATQAFSQVHHNLIEDIKQLIEQRKRTEAAQTAQLEAASEAQDAQDTLAHVQDEHVAASAAFGAIEQKLSAQVRDCNKVHSEMEQRRTRMKMKLRAMNVAMLALGPAE